jgi:endonuclease YncB( thermonuclease family)
MSHDWRKKKTRIKIPSDKTLGVAVLGGIAIVVALTLMVKKEENISINKALPSIQAVRVIDGDTIEFSSENVRLFGIDAPEKGQPCKRNNAPYDCGTASKKYLEFLLSGAKVDCAKKNKGKWGRYIALCTADGEDISKLMVRHGWAVAYRKYSTAYIEDEKFAKSNRLGMWSKEFSIPSEWRKSDRGDKL